MKCQNLKLLMSTVGLMTIAIGVTSSAHAQLACRDLLSTGRSAARWSFQEAQAFASARGVVEYRPVDEDLFIVVVDPQHLNLSSLKDHGNGFVEPGHLIGLVRPSRDGIDPDSWLASQRLTGPISPVTSIFGYSRQTKELIVGLKPAMIHQMIDDGAGGQMQTNIYIPARSELVAIHSQTGAQRPLLEPVSWLGNFGLARGSYRYLNHGVLVDGQIFFVHPRIGELVGRVELDSLDSNGARDEDITYTRTVLDNPKGSHELSDLVAVTDANGEIKLWALAKRNLGSSRQKKKILVVDPKEHHNQLTRVTLPELDLDFIATTPDQNRVIGGSVTRFKDNVVVDLYMIDSVSEKIVGELRFERRIEAGDPLFEATRVEGLRSDGHFAFVRFADQKSLAVDLADFVPVKDSQMKSSISANFERIVSLPIKLAPGAMFRPSSSPDVMEIIFNNGAVTSIELNLKQRTVGKPRLLSENSFLSNEAIHGPLWDAKLNQFIYFKDDHVVSYDPATDKTTQIAELPQSRQDHHNVSPYYYMAISKAMQLVGDRIIAFHGHSFYMVEFNSSRGERIWTQAISLWSGRSEKPEAKVQVRRYPFSETVEYGQALEDGNILVSTETGSMHLLSPQGELLKSFQPIQLEADEGTRDLIPLQFMEHQGRIIALAGAAVSVPTSQRMDKRREGLYALELSIQDDQLKLESLNPISSDSFHADDRSKALVKSEDGEIFATDDYQLYRLF